MNSKFTLTILVSLTVLILAGSAIAAVCEKDQNDGSNWHCTSTGGTCSDTFEWSNLTTGLGSFVANIHHKTATYKCTNEGNATGFVLHNNDILTFEEWSTTCDEITV